MSDNLSDTGADNIEKMHVGNLTDFVEGVSEDNPLYIEVAVNEAGKVIVFHDKPFRSEVSWYEYDLTTSTLSFILEDGEIRDSGMKLVPTIAKHMQNSHQILMVLMNSETGDATEGNYVPLIIHKD